MRTVTLKSIIEGAWIKEGQDPDFMQANQRRAIVEHINDRLGFAWDYFPFPEFKTRLIYVPTAGVIPLEAVGRAGINQVLECRQSVDALGTTLGHPLTYALDNRGIIVPRDMPFVSVEHTLMPPTFTGIAWAAATYPAGSLVYHIGDTWEALQSTAVEPAASEPTMWRKVAFPYILARAVKTGAAIDLLREDGQTDKATGEEARFIQRLDEAVEAVTILQNQRNTYNVTAQ